MKTMIATPLLALLLAAAAPALAHGSMKPQHGGQVVMTGETLFELTASPAGVALYVEEDDEPVNAAAMTAKLTVSANGKKQEVALVPAGGNRFIAKGLRLPKGAKVGVLIIDTATKARSSALFTMN